MYSMLMQIQVLLTASLVAPPVYGDVCMSVSTGANPGDAPGASTPNPGRIQDPLVNLNWRSGSLVMFIYRV